MWRSKRRRQHADVLPRTSTVGVAPGTMVVDPCSAQTEIHLTAYGPDRFTDHTVVDLQEIQSFLQNDGVVWINVEGLGSEQTLKGLAEMFHLHPLAVEDTVNLNQRTKVDRYGEQLYIVLRIPRETLSCGTEQVSMYLGRNFLITFLEDPGDCFDPVRRRIRENDGMIRRRGPDYLAYALLDSAVDAYFPILESFGEHLEELEDEVVLTPTRSIVARIHDSKHDLRMMRRVIWPMREAMNGLTRDQSSLICDETRVYFRDLYDHTVQIIDIVETYREVGADLTDLYLSSLSNRMNEIMRVLTIIATIFIPLSFVTGLYGMNFNTEVSPYNMPELHWRYGYPMMLALTATIAGGMLIFFWRRGWLGRQANLSDLRIPQNDE